MKIKESQHRAYDIIMSVLAIAAVILAVIDMSQGLNFWQEWADHALLAIFYIDYIVRLIIVPEKWEFIKSNIWDLIALIPFRTIFRSFKIFSLVKLSRYAKLPRVFGLLYRPLRKANRFFNTNGFKYVVFITTVMIILGGILIHFAEGMSYGDGIWWAFVTTTTVGYGDISPSTFYGRAIAMVLMIVGIGLIGSITSTLTSYFLGYGEKNVKDEALESIIAELNRFDELSEQDVDDICKILKALKK